MEFVFAHGQWSNLIPSTESLRVPTDYNNPNSLNLTTNDENSMNTNDTYGQYVLRDKDGKERTVLYKLSPRYGENSNSNNGDKIQEGESQTNTQIYPQVYRYTPAYGYVPQIQQSTATGASLPGNHQYPGNLQVAKGFQPIFNTTYASSPSLPSTNGWNAIRYGSSVQFPSAQYFVPFVGHTNPQTIFPTQYSNAVVAPNHQQQQQSHSPSNVVYHYYTDPSEVEVPTRRPMKKSRNRTNHVRANIYATKLNEIPDTDVPTRSTKKIRFKDDFESVTKYRKPTRHRHNHNHHNHYEDDLNGNKFNTLEDIENNDIATPKNTWYPSTHKIVDPNCDKEPSRSLINHKFVEFKAPTKLPYKPYKMTIKLPKIRMRPKVITTTQRAHVKRNGYKPVTSQSVHTFTIIKTPIKPIRIHSPFKIRQPFTSNVMGFL